MEGRIVSPAIVLGLGDSIRVGSRFPDIGARVLINDSDHHLAQGALYRVVANQPAQPNRIHLISVEVGAVAVITCQGAAVKRVNFKQSYGVASSHSFDLAY
jgi:hypothetical protein